VTGPLRTKKPQDDPQREAFLRKRKADQEAKAKQKAAARAAKQKAITTDSSEDDSSEEEYSGLFKLADRTRRVLTDAHVVEAPKRQPRKAPRIIKPVKDTRARVPPDMSPLFKQIFKWDFFHDGAFPPGLSASSYTSVAKSFKAFGVYQKTFEPLLLLEAWQSFLKCKEEAMPSGFLEVKISSRMRSDHFVELETTIDSMPDRNRWFEADVILLSTNKDPLRSGGKDPHCIARVHTVNRKFTGKSTASLRCDPGPIMLQNHMRNGGTLYGIKIMR
jgi:senataxin